LPTSPLRPGQGPHSGDDTDDLTGHALGQLAERRGAWPGDDLTAITLTASLTGQAGRFLPELVTSARLNGHTWRDIAQAAGPAVAGVMAGMPHGPRDPPEAPRFYSARGSRRRRSSAVMRTVRRPPGPGSVIQALWALLQLNAFDYRSVLARSSFAEQD
jgi:hypothetical protein